MIGSTLIVFLGIRCCRVHTHFKDDKEKLLHWGLWSLFLLAITAIFNGFTENEGLIPINKNLWSVTFVTVMAGFAFFMIAVLYFLQDMKQWWAGRPFYFMGRNSMFVYLAHDLCGRLFPMDSDVVDGHAWKLGYNVAAITVWCLISAYCYWIDYQLII